MDKYIADKNIVFVGVFQPSKFDKFFFIKNNIFSEDEILEPTVFNQDISQVITGRTNVVVLFNQVIITQVNTVEDDLMDIAMNILSILARDVTALGINFTWNAKPQVSLQVDSKLLFFNENNKMFANFFNVPDAVYGSYVSKDIENGRLKLNINPQIVKQVKEAGDVKQTQILAEIINFAFNFHFEIENKEFNKILFDAIGNYYILKKDSENIMSTYD